MFTHILGFSPAVFFQGANQDGYRQGLKLHKIVCQKNFLVQPMVAMPSSKFFCMRCKKFASHAKAPVQLFRNLVVAGARWSP